MTTLLEQRLTDHRIKPTAMRLLVLEYLLSRQSALGLSDIEKAMAPADRITIYRTLKTFEQNGLVHLIDDGTGVHKYALCDNCDPAEHHDTHVHFYCTVCKETYCLPDTKIPDIGLPAGFILSEMNLIVKGHCDKCRL
ncbi:transcriptional repressor [Mucilaginibacter sp. RS28]|uniref:Transcriptional repressor n=1 Tax=Mucilaginibacter straminoryzae TaxID=2932774 RepID=A0A9X1X6T7_9SPHI|nr:transcriptional repressor [Mucilaginibacter straminoryzae]MCJ8211210.1 transcriptional repressor [Mucilaginibacter straminoryzae]